MKLKTLYSVAGLLCLVLSAVGSARPGWRGKGLEDRRGGFPYRLDGRGRATDQRRGQAGRSMGSTTTAASPWAARSTRSSSSARTPRERSRGHGRRGHQAGGKRRGQVHHRRREPGHEHRGQLHHRSRPACCAFPTTPARTPEESGPKFPLTFFMNSNVQGAPGHVHLVEEENYPNVKTIALSHPGDGGGENRRKHLEPIGQRAGPEDRFQRGEWPGETMDFTPFVKKALDNKARRVRVHRRLGLSRGRPDQGPALGWLHRPGAFPTDSEIVSRGARRFPARS